MRFIINGDLVPNTKSPNTFEVAITTLAADGDGYNEVVVGPFRRDADEAAMQSLLETLDAMADSVTEEYGAGYWDVPNFRDWFDPNWIPQAHRFDEFEWEPTKETSTAYLHRKELLENGGYPFSWLYSSQGYSDTYYSCTVFYYDEDKGQHEVVVVLD